MWGPPRCDVGPLAARGLRQGLLRQRGSVHIHGAAVQAAAECGAVAFHCGCSAQRCARLFSHAATFDLHRRSICGIDAEYAHGHLLHHIR